MSPEWTIRYLRSSDFHLLKCSRNYLPSFFNKNRLYGLDLEFFAMQQLEIIGYTCFTDRIINKKLHKILFGRSTRIKVLDGTSIYHWNRYIHIDERNYTIS